MTIGILGKKLGMTQLFTEDGTVVPVTVILAGPCRVLQVKTKEATELPEDQRSASTNKGKKTGTRARPRRDDGYYGVQIGFEPKAEKHSTKAERGHGAKSGASPMRFVREMLDHGLRHVYRTGSPARSPVVAVITRSVSEMIFTM